jgi:hypothetical protein
MTQTWGTRTDTGFEVTGTHDSMKALVEANTPLKRGWTGEWVPYLVVRGVAEGEMYVRRDSQGRIRKSNGGFSRFNTGPVIRPVK